MSKKNPPFDPLEQKYIQNEISKHAKDVIESRIPQPRGIDFEKEPHIVRSVIHFSAMGITPLAISKQIGLAVDAVREIVRSKSAQDEIYRLQKQFIEKDFKQVFMRILPVAINTAQGIMMSKRTKDNVRLQAADIFMDRALGKPTQVIEEKNNLLSEILQKMSGETPKNSEETIEAEFEKLAEANSEAMNAIDAYEEQTDDDLEEEDESWENG